MAWLAYFRIVIYLAVITVHVANCFYMAWFSRQNQNKPEESLIFKNLEYRFFTTWTYVSTYQVFYLHDFKFNLWCPTAGQLQIDPSTSTLRHL